MVALVHIGKGVEALKARGAEARLRDGRGSLAATVGGFGDSCHWSDQRSFLNLILLHKNISYEKYPIVSEIEGIVIGFF